MKRIVIVPGNGCASTKSANWYGWAHARLEKMYAGSGVEVVAPDMPDPFAAREREWIPFLETMVDASTVVVGHSSGAEAAMRLAEKHVLYGIVLVSACVTDLGDAGEREAGWYNRRWEFEAMKSNCSRRYQFASKDDPFLPFEAEQMAVARGFDTQLTVFEDRLHIWQQTFPELIDLFRKEFPPA